MDVSALFIEIVEVYSKHGWQLRRVLMRPETRLQFDQNKNRGGEQASFVEAAVDALWFSRPSHSGREAWELRLLSENPYALFETFESDETQEQRDEMLLEMENRMREYLTAKRAS